MNTPHKYIPSRLVTYRDLPGYRWKYVTSPKSLAHNMGGVPVDPNYEFGIIETDRFVLQNALEHAGLTRWVEGASPHDQLVEAIVTVLKREED